MSLPPGTPLGRTGRFIVGPEGGVLDTAPRRRSTSNRVTHHGGRRSLSVVAARIALCACVSCMSERNPSRTLGSVA